MKKIVKKTIIAFVVCLFAASCCFASSSIKEGGEGGGEETWKDRYFVHYEYVPLYRGYEFPRMIYRATGTIGDRNMVGSVGVVDFKASGILNVSNSRKAVQVFDARPLFRYDVLIFTDFANRAEKSYIVENYPYRDHHKHEYYYETPHTVAGFGTSGSPSTGLLGFEKLYASRAILEKYVEDFKIAGLVPHADHGNDPRGERLKMRTWYEGETEYNSYVWRLDDERVSFGWWRAFTPYILGAIDGVNEDKKLHENKKALLEAEKFFREKADKTERETGTTPDWLKRALEGKSGYSNDIFKEYVFKYKNVFAGADGKKSNERAKEYITVDAARLPDWFPGVLDVIKIWKSAAETIVEILEKGLETSGRFGTYDSKLGRILPPWGTTPYDNAGSAYCGWILWNKPGTLTFQFTSEDSSVLGHWIYSYANSELYRRGTGTGIIKDAGTPEKNFENLLRELGVRTFSLENPSNQRRIWDEMTTAKALPFEDIEKAKRGIAEEKWTEILGNHKSPWSLLQKILPNTYRSLLFWSSMRMSVVFMDLSDSVGWGRGIRYSAEPSVLFAMEADLGNNPRVLTRIRPDKEKIPEKYQGEWFNEKKVNAHIDAWKTNVETTVKTLNNSAVVRSGLLNAFPVDWGKRDQLKKAVDNAFATFELTDDEGNLAFLRLFGAPKGNRDGERIGAGNWELNIEETKRENIDFFHWFQDYSRQSFHYGKKLTILQPPAPDEITTTADGRRTSVTITSKKK